MSAESSDNLRKAAILVSSLDDSTATRLLLELDPALRTRVREAASELGTPSPAEQAAIMKEFCRITANDSPAVPPTSPDDAIRHETPATAVTPQAAPAEIKPPGETPFEFLQAAPAEVVLELLEEESAQTIAIVLGHLQPARSSQILAALPAPVQLEVIRRLMGSAEVHPHVTDEVARAMQIKWSRRSAVPSREPGVLADILESADNQTEDRILQGVSRRDRPLAHQASGRTENVDLEHLDDRTLSDVLELANPDVLLLALAGSSQSLVERVLGELPPREAKSLRSSLCNLGMVRLSDIEAARQALVNLVRRLRIERRRDVPLRKGFAELSA